MQYRSHYIVKWKPAYIEMLRRSLPADEASLLDAQTLIVSATQGGFGEGVADHLRGIKERFLEREYEIREVNFEISGESFDTYFELIEPDDVIDLDED